MWDISEWYIPHFLYRNQCCVRTHNIDLCQKDMVFINNPHKKVACARKQSYLCIVKKNKKRSLKE